MPPYLHIPPPLHLRLLGDDQGIQVLHHEPSFAEIRAIFNPLRVKKNRADLVGEILFKLKMVGKTWVFTLFLPQLSSTCQQTAFAQKKI